MKNIVVMRAQFYDEVPLVAKYAERTRKYFTDSYGECEVIHTTSQSLPEGKPNVILLFKFTDHRVANRVKQRYHGRILFKARVSTAFLDLQQATELDLNFANISISEALTKTSTTKKKKKKPNRSVEDQVKEWSKIFEGDTSNCPQTSPYRAIFYSNASDDSASPTPPPSQKSPEPIRQLAPSSSRDPAQQLSRYKIYDGPDPVLSKKEEERETREQHESNMMGSWTASTLYTKPVAEEVESDSSADDDDEDDDDDGPKKPQVSFSMASCLSFLKDDLQISSEKKSKSSSSHHRSTSSEHHSRSHSSSRRVSEPSRERERERESRKDSFEARHRTSSSSSSSTRVRSRERRERGHGGGGGDERDSSHSTDRPVFSADKRSYNKSYYSRSRDNSREASTQSRHWSGNSSSSPYHRPPAKGSSEAKKQGDLRELISSQKKTVIKSEIDDRPFSQGSSQESSRSTTPTLHSHTKQMAAEATHIQTAPSDSAGLAQPQVDYQQMIMSHLQQYGPWPSEEARSRSGTPVMDETPGPVPGQPTQVHVPEPISQEPVHVPVPQVSGPVTVQVPGSVPAQAPGSVPAQAPGPVPAQVPGSVPAQAPGPVPQAQVPGPVPVQVPGPIPQAQVPGSVPVQVSGPVPVQVPGPVPQAQVPVHVPGSVPVQVLGPVTQVQVPGPVPVQVPGPTQVQVPGPTPVQVPGPVPAQAPEPGPTPPAPRPASTPASRPTSTPSEQAPVSSEPVPVSSEQAPVSSSPTAVVFTEPGNDNGPVPIPVSGGPIHAAGPIPIPGSIAPGLVNIPSPMLPFNIPGHIPRPIVLFPGPMLPGSMVPSLVNIPGPIPTSNLGPVSMMPSVIPSPIPAVPPGLIPANVSVPASMMPTIIPRPVMSNTVCQNVPDASVGVAVPDPASTPDVVTTPLEPPAASNIDTVSQSGDVSEAVSQKESTSEVAVETDATIPDVALCDPFYDSPLAYKPVPAGVNAQKHKERAMKDFHEQAKLLLLSTKLLAKHQPDSINDLATSFEKALMEIGKNSLEQFRKDTGIIK